jgi:hypothetical protein
VGKGGTVGAGDYNFAKENQAKIIDWGIKILYSME